MVQIWERGKQYRGSSYNRGLGTIKIGETTKSREKRKGYYLRQVNNPKLNYWYYHYYYYNYHFLIIYYYYYSSLIFKTS